MPRRAVSPRKFLSWATGSYLRSIKANSSVNDKHVETLASLILLYYVDALYETANWKIRGKLRRDKIM